MSKIQNKRLRSTFKGEEHLVTLEQQVMSTALAIEALERLLIARGMLKAGELEQAVDALLREKQAPAERLVQLLT